MLSDRIINDTELLKYSNNTSIADRTKALLAHQIENWDLAKNGYESLSRIERKEFDFDDFKIVVQFNPGRIKSSSAKVDKESIEARKCFLCYKNLPASQMALAYYRDYLILVNPYPIFNEHFTIPKVDHIPQRIEYNLKGMLNLSKDFGKYYTVFYNGPKCGASAPDHMHFQACAKNNMPLEIETDLINKKSETLYENEKISVKGITDYLRTFFLLESNNPEEISDYFLVFYKIFGELFKTNEEPLLNIIITYDKIWRIYIFPRTKHRPAEYFLKGKNRILISPAAVDLGGLFITPREEDFNKISEKDIKNIFRQVTLPNEYYEFIKNRFEEIKTSM